MSIKMTSIRLKNFIGIYTGLSKKDLFVDLSKLSDKDIIIILGENGTGKSTFASVLHPLPGTTDKRNKFIREGKDGLKVIEYLRSDGVRFRCKIIYSATKTGHTARGYFTRITDDNEAELNPNGNISSYKDLLFDELGVSDAMLKLANQNDVCKGHVDMTSTERKINMSTFLPEDIYSHYYAIADKYYKELKTRINILVQSIGRLDDKTVIASKLEDATNKINELVAKRDKVIGKIKELETKISMLRKDGDLDDKERKLLKSIKGFDKELESIRDDMHEIYSNDLSNVISPDDSVEKLKKFMEQLSKQIADDNIAIKLLESSLLSLKGRRSSIQESISAKEIYLSSISRGTDLEGCKKLLKEYNDKRSELIKEIDGGNLSSSIIRNDFMVGYEIIDTIRKMIDNIRESTFYDTVEEAVKMYSNRKSIDRNLSEYEIKFKEAEAKSSNLQNRIDYIDSQKDMKTILENRPENCKIDDCPFIAKAMQWSNLSKELDDISRDLEEANRDKDKYAKKIHDLSLIDDVHIKIDELFRYINTYSKTIEKLPNNKSYSSQKAILKAILNPNLLADADDFDYYISILEDKDELNYMDTEVIPAIKNDIKVLETEGQFIDMTRKELLELEVELEKVNLEIQKSKNNIDSMTEQYEFRLNLLESLNKFNSHRLNYETISNDRKTDNKELKRIQSILEDISKYENKLSDKKKKLKEIEKDLKPLTNTREILKMQQLKIADYEMELVAVNEDMYKCEIVRDSLSVKGDGIPVDALELFMESVRNNANALLSNTFNGSLYLEEFEINSRDFIIPYKKNGDRGIDVSYASSSERSFISLCLTLAIIEEVISKYGILILDEIDRGFSDNNKYKFINILGTQIRRVGISQTFMITHNREYYDGYDLGYILFPGHSLTGIDTDDCIEVYK